MCEALVFSPVKWQHIKTYFVKPSFALSFPDLIHPSVLCGFFLIMKKDLTLLAFKDQLFNASIS